MWWHMPVIPDTQEAEVGGSPFKANPGKVSMSPLSEKQTESERTRKWLKSGKCEALGSIPSTIKKKEKKLC
jgi:hypothetical protein